MLNRATVLTSPILCYQVSTADVAKHEVVAAGQKTLLLPQRVDDHEVEQDAVNYRYYR